MPGKISPLCDLVLHDASLALVPTVTADEVSAYSHATWPWYFTWKQAHYQAISKLGFATS